MRRARPQRTVGIFAAAALAGTTAGCGNQSTLSPDSHASHVISNLWWGMLAGSAVLFAVVVALLLYGLLKRHGSDPDEREPIGSGTWIVAIGGFVVPLVVLVALFVVTVAALPATSPGGKTQMTIDVAARQWFWSVDYPAAGVRTANEIHIPVGVPVLVRVASPDVIHSLWVPALNRKIDVIPGQVNEVIWEADRPGVFRGQCAEYCGVEHARMALYVVAEARPQFEAWLRGQAGPAAQPSTEYLERGQQIFLGSACEYCHTIAGTNATGTIGPDLTHIASRLSIGAGTLPNNEGNLAGWILDPQHFKPDNKMPATALTGSELQPLLAYLESLH